jgi:hypothetical protein
LVPAVLFYNRSEFVELVKTSGTLAAVLGQSVRTRRTAKICVGVIAGTFLLQFYYVRELLFMEAVLALGFAVVALIGALYGLGYITALWLRKLGSELKAVVGRVSVRHRESVARTTTLALSKVKEEVF